MNYDEEREQDGFRIQEDSSATAEGVAKVFLPFRIRVFCLCKEHLQSADKVWAVEDILSVEICGKRRSAYSMVFLSSH